MQRPLYSQLVPYYDLVEGRDWQSEIGLIVSVLKKHGLMSVIDLGCGPGYQARALARYGFDVTGIDISRQNIRFARRMALRKRVHPRFIVGSYYNYHPSELFDAALCLNWSIPTKDGDLMRFLHNTRSMLRIGGLLIFDFERVSDIVRKDLGKPVLNTWKIKGLTIVRVSLGRLVSNVLHSTDVYTLFSNRNGARLPNESERYRPTWGRKPVKIYVDSSYVRFFSVTELRRVAAHSKFKLIANHVLPRNQYKRNYAVLARV